MKNILLTTLLLSAVTLPGFSGNGTKAPAPPAKHFTMPAKVKKGDYLPNTVIVKLLPEHRASASRAAIMAPGFAKAAEDINVSSVRQMFPSHSAPAARTNQLGQRMVDLSLIYVLKLEETDDLETAINRLLKSGIFEYVEPHYVPKLSYTPNDPQVGSQYHISKIQALAAWELTKGDTNVVIGITDTGVEFAHTDLTGNIKYNYNDPIDGVDNDNDGYIDNYRGWDVADNDNNPQWAADGHGVHVSGCSSAMTDNAKGVAGSGFKCKFLPVKISDANGDLVASYEGIVYAADMGCQIINCSWGGPGGGWFGQDIINYATINKNSLVIAAAGNDNSQTDDHFPSAYDKVLSVASTTSTDAKSSFSNYGYTIDVCAPGTSILATWPTNTYSQQSGTSMASPVAAGAAAIIKSYFPNYTALQVSEQLKRTADNIYSVNSSYKDKLGTGRINMYKALTVSTPSVVLENRKDADNNDNSLAIGDTLLISGDFINYLAPTTSACVATLSSTSTYITILDNSFTVGSVPTLGLVNSEADPFKVKINSNAPLNASILFKLTITDGTTYTSTSFFRIIVNVDYLNIMENDVITTVTSKGRIGYNLDAQAQGMGFMYKGSSMLYESSLMLGTGGTKVSDMFRGGAAGDADNSTLVRVAQIPSVFSEFDFEGKFNDAASPSPIGIETVHHAYAWTTPGDRKYVIFAYDLKNTTTATISNLYAGIIADWDIMDYAKNKGAYSAASRMGYTYSTETNGLYGGVKVLTGDPVVHYAIDNIAGGSGGVDLTAGSPEFSTDEKFTVLSTNRSAAGGSGTGNDIIQSVSTGPITIAPGEIKTVAFAMLAGDNLTDLETSASNAQIKWDGTPVKATVISQGDITIMPNPASTETMIHIPGTEGSAVVCVYNSIGKKVVAEQAVQLNNDTAKMRLNTSQLSSGVYFVRISSCNKETVKKLVIRN